MASWREVKLEDICEITSSKRIFMADYVDSGIPFYRSKEIIEKQRGNNISTELFITEEKYEEIKQKFSVPQEGDILLTSVGTLGIPYIVRENEKFYFKDGNLTWIKKSKNFLPEYLYYYLISDEGKFKLENISIGTTQKAITIVGLKGLEISLPPLDIQKKIAGVLGALDDKIELNSKINNNLEQQAQALFKSWFVDFEPFGGTMPKDWKVGNLLDIADYLNGLAMQKFRPAENDKGLPVLKIKELRQGFCDSNSELCSLNVKNEYIVNDGDVIFSWSGSLLVDFWCGGKCGLNQHLFKVTSKNFDKWFYFLWTKHYLEHFAFIAADKATTMGHIKREELEKAKVIIPSSECYQKMKQIMTPIYDLLISNRVENTRLSALRDALLPKLMSGEIDVSKVDISALTSTDKLSFTGV